MRKKWKFIYPTIIFIIFFSLPVFALPAQDVEVITDREYFQVIHQALKRATQSIQLMMFEISYNKKYPDNPNNILIEDLTDAHKRDVNVEVILEVGTWERVTNKNKKVGQILSRNGIQVAHDPSFVTTHAKLIIIDGKISILGSTNWTYYSLARNNEVSVLIRSKEVAQKLSDYFQGIWKTCQHGREE